MLRRPGGILVSSLVLAGAAAALAGCGGGDSSGADEFLGTWTYAASSGDFMCDTVPTQPGSVSGNKVFEPGVVSDLVATWSAADVFTPFCNFRFDIKDKVATMQPGQVCNIAGSGDTLSPMSWTFTLLSATTAEEAGMVNASLTFVNQMTNQPVHANCTRTFGAMLSKVAKN